MSELNPKLPQRLRETLEHYYSAPAPRPEFAARLEAQLRQNVERTRPRQDAAERMSFMRLAQARPLLAILIILLILLTLSGVVYAIGRAVGFIPGVGIVDQSMPLRVLTEPVVAERDGLTVTVSQVVADSDHTFVAYGVDGIPQPKNGFPICGVASSFQLPDGSTLDSLSSSGAQFGGERGELLKFETTVYYPPIPVDIDHVTLVFPCILQKGTGPENWQIALELSPAPEGYATPAVEIGATFVASNPQFVTTPTPASDAIFTPESYDPSFLATPTLVPHGSGLYLERVIELADSYILVGNFTDAGDLPGELQVSGDPYDYLPHIEDGLGNPVAFEVRDDILQPGVTWGGIHSWAYEIAKPVHGPLTIILDQIDISVSDSTQFKFDTGPNPKIGQKWELNLPIHLRTYDYVVDSVEMIENGYTFRFHFGVDVPWETSFSFEIVGSSQKRGPASGQEDGRDKTMVKCSETITYLVPPPTGQLTVELTLFESIPLPGPWTLTWTPPSK